MSTFYETVMGRKSARSYDGRMLTDEDRGRLESFAQSIENPFGVSVDFVFLEAEEYGLSSPVLTGEKLYAAGLVDKVPNADVAYGYAFEQLVLYAWSLGIGTVWIGGTMKRELFENAAGLTEGRRMPCISPLGYPAPRRSVKESLMRKGIKADSRRPAEELFFDGDFATPLAAEGSVRKALELVRRAPSAVNKQPWRVVREGEVYHFFVKHDKGFINEATGDLQKIDVGIALYHFVRGLEEEGIGCTVSIGNPAIGVPDDMEYIATVSPRDMM